MSSIITQNHFPSIQFSILQFLIKSLQLFTKKQNMNLFQQNIMKAPVHEIVYYGMHLPFVYYKVHLNTFENPKEMTAEIISET